MKCFFACRVIQEINRCVLFLIWSFLRVWKKNSIDLTSLEKLDCFREVWHTTDISGNYQNQWNKTIKLEKQLLFSWHLGGIRWGRALSHGQEHRFPEKYKKHQFFYTWVVLLLSFYRRGWSTLWNWP